MNDYCFKRKCVQLGQLLITHPKFLCIHPSLKLGFLGHKKAYTVGKYRLNLRWSVASESPPYSTPKVYMEFFEPNLWGRECIHIKVAVYMKKLGVCC